MQLRHRLVVVSLMLVAADASSDECGFVVPKGFPVDEYAAIVTQYRTGRFTSAGKRLEALEAKRVDEVFEFFRSQGWSAPCILAASLLHTEVGMQGVKRAPLDGEMPDDFERAWDLMSLVPAKSIREPFQRDWLLVMGLFYQRLIYDPEIIVGQTEQLSLGLKLYREARTFFKDAIEAYPEDPEILLAAGTLFEWSGAPNFGEPDHLKRAEELYRRASSLDPNDPVAQLRYGITLWKRDRSERSVTPLRRVLELTDDGELAFRAHMALGRIETLTGSGEKAIAHFRSAVALKPGWQIGALALSHALHREGARDEARDVLERGLDVPWIDDSLFGWWSYEVGMSGRFGPLLESMRAEVSSQ